MLNYPVDLDRLDAPPLRAKAAIYRRRTIVVAIIVTDMRHKFKRHTFFSSQVVQNGLEILTYLADRMGHDFKPYISTIIQPTIDRLGEYETYLFHLICLVNRFTRCEYRRPVRDPSHEFGKFLLLFMVIGKTMIYENPIIGTDQTYISTYKYFI